MFFPRRGAKKKVSAHGQRHHLCLSFFTDKILKGFDDGLLTGMILIDLQKAFDTNNHEILLKKLKAMSFSEGCIT